MKMNTVAGFTFGVVLILVNFTACYAQLTTGFYANKCKINVEDTVQRIVSQRIADDPTLVAALIRMQFHDCFVQGCDASLLLDGDGTEKTAGPNGSVRGYELIDEIKTELEGSCPNTVSCADIIAMATRDTIASSGGSRYEVQTGRRDGLVSLASDADTNLPSPSISVSGSITVFAGKGLNATDMVLLLGGHTVGKASCGNFESRLSPQDPSMDKTLAEELKKTCAKDSNNRQAALDQNPSSTNIVDNSFYNQIRMNRGLLSIDQQIAFDSSTSELVRSLSMGNAEFLTRFGAAMVKLGAVGVKVGNEGEIRQKCRFVNSASTTPSLPFP
ncbi:hypothetical protein MKW94_003106 [Papaver nudicaule]|uniref:Peroxidase n=1 Tax=Papaver nudicaule TaxID=74823 RepID=A0AA41S7H6_PAPNU|nr:hypothetical protein [Papaver nudicaule]